MADTLLRFRTERCSRQNREIKNLCRSKQLVRCEVFEPSSNRCHRVARKTDDQIYFHANPGVHQRRHTFFKRFHIVASVHQSLCGRINRLPPAADVDPVSGVSSGVAMSARSRGKNIGLAQADRQAVFKGDWAACHSDYADAQFGHDLYDGACAICHDAEHRASMVPDLRIVDESRDADYWREHITDGIEGTLMPAFAKKKHGILTDEQIESLIKFLVETPLKPTTVAP